MAEPGWIVRVEGGPGGASLEVVDSGFNLVRMREVNKYAANHGNIRQVGGWKAYFLVAGD